MSKAEMQRKMAEKSYENILTLLNGSKMFGFIDINKITLEEFGTWLTIMCKVLYECKTELFKVDNMTLEEFRGLMYRHKDRIVTVAEKYMVVNENEKV